MHFVVGPAQYNGMAWSIAPRAEGVGRDVGMLARCPCSWPSCLYMIALKSGCQIESRYMLSMCREVLPCLRLDLESLFQLGLSAFTYLTTQHHANRHPLTPMLRRQAISVSRQCRHFASGRASRPVVTLPDASLDTFRRDAFLPAIPALLPRQHFAALPAIHKWFTGPSKATPIELNATYLAKYGATIVPLEISHNEQFARVEQSLSFFLECAQASTSHHNTPRNRYFSSYVPGARAVKRTKQPNDFFSASTAAPTARVYLAQASISNLPRALQLDVPTPQLVTHAGKGDIYDSSIWLGQAPTYTPLHKDPNPNLFVQLAGKKIVRLFKPDVGRAIFAKVQETIGGSASETMRGEEMMQGAEKEALEREVWQRDSSSFGECWEAELKGGDALFIPKGYWHSIKGVGKGMTGSVNWWFR